MPLHCPEDARGLFSSLRGSLVGVGMTAYSRIIPSYFSKNYRIIALRKTGDLEILRNKAEVFCLEEEIGRAVKEPGFQSARLLSHPLTRQYLKGLPDPKYLFLYQSYPELEELAREESWILLANPSGLRTQAGSRSFFNRLIQNLRLNAAPGLMYPIHELWVQEYVRLAEKVGYRFVVQLPEVRQGGGRGTFFITSKEEFQTLRSRLKEGVWRGSKLETISLRRFIEGVPASIALCVTGKGILHSRLQIQLLDLPFSRSIPENGVFCGHSWGGTPFPGSVGDAAAAQTLPIGEHMGKMGYRGILGIDLIIEKGTGKVYPMEINPRLTGAFPMLSQLHIGSGLIPMEVIHLAEFLGVPYQTDLFSMNLEYGKEVKGSHLILFLMERRLTPEKQALKGGLYEMAGDGESASFVKPAMDYRDITNDAQFIIIDGPPDGEPGSDDPLYRICRLLFGHPVEGPGNAKLKEALRAAEWVYRQMLV
jgi:hypothetical protein